MPIARIIARLFPARDTERPPGKQHWAFVSYDHDDKDIAARFHERLETYRLPSELNGEKSDAGSLTIPQYLQPVYLDKHEAAASANLEKEIDDALRSSHALVVIASPRSAQSDWVNKEVRTFKSLGGSARTFALIIDGTPNVADLRIPGDECFCPALRREVDEDGEILEDARVQPAGADLRADGEHDALLRIVAGILDIGYAALKKRDLNRRVRRAWRLAGVAAGLVAVLSALGAVAYTQWQTALAGRAGMLAAQARSEARPNLSRALLLALEAPRVKATPEARQPLPSLLADLTALPEFFWSEQQRVRKLVLSPDEKLAASAGDNGDIVLFDIDQRKQAGVLTGDHDAWVWDVAFHPRRGEIASVWANGKVRIWDVATRREIYTIDSQIDPSLAGKPELATVAFDAQGARLAYGGDDNLIRLFDLRAGKPIGTLQGHSHVVRTVAFSPDGRWVVSGADDEPPIVWDAATRVIRHRLIGHAGAVFSIAFNPDGTLVASAGQDGKVRLWDAERGTALGCYGGHRSEVFSVAFSRDGGTIASGGFDSEIRVWKPALFGAQTLQNCSRSDTPLASLRSHGSALTGLAFATDGSLYSAGVDYNLTRWRDIGRNPLVQRFAEHEGKVFGMSLSRDGTTLAAARSNGTVTVWKQVATKWTTAATLLHGRDARIAAVALNAKGDRLASAGDDKRVVVWDLVSASPIAQLREFEGEIHSLAFSPDDALLAGGDDRSVHLWSTADHAEKAKIPMHDQVLAVAFSPDGGIIAAGGAMMAEDKRTFRVLLLSTTRALPVGRLDGHEGRVTGLAFSPNGLTLASSSWDRQLRVWDVHKQEQRSDPLVGHRAEVTGVAFHPDGRTIASASWDNSVILWDLETGRALADPLDLHDGHVSSVVFTLDGAQLLSGGHDGYVMRWEARHSEWERLACLIANRDLSRKEWSQYIGWWPRPRPTCSRLPP